MVRFDLGMDFLDVGIVVRHVVARCPGDGDAARWPHGIPIDGQSRWDCLATFHSHVFASVLFGGGVVCLFWYPHLHFGAMLH